MGFKLLEPEVARHHQVRNGPLAEALERVHTLKGMLPICAWCKKIRDDQGYWTQVEAYVSTRANLSGPPSAGE